MKKFGLIVLILAILNCTAPFGTAKSKTNPAKDSKGYVGTLPDLTRKDVPKEETQPKIQAIPTKEFNSSNEIKPIPETDPTFVNIILKKDKTSQYVNDVREFIPMLETLCDLIEDGTNVQVFNAKVYFFNKNADYFRDKYAQKPEAQYISYQKLMDLNTHAKSIALLRMEAEKYNPYLAYGSSGYIYNPNNIREQLGFLKSEIEQTIIILREAD